MLVSWYSRFMYVIYPNQVTPKAFRRKEISPVNQYFMENKTGSGAFGQGFVSLVMSAISPDNRLLCLYIYSIWSFE